MKKILMTVLPPLLCAALLFAASAAEPLQSGPQAGQKIPGPFKPLHATGPDAGDHVCLVCKNGANPVAMVFARSVSAPLTVLIKKIDAATAAHQDAEMGSFVVFLSDDPSLPGALKGLADKNGVKQTVLATFAPAGPPAYHVAPEADVTVVLYAHHKAVANYAFRQGDLNDKAIDAILADVPKIVGQE
jgi:hypothetical protein